ncbi:hypothetical protein INR49_019643, partial [Caranx melampygus]
MFCSGLTQTHGSKNSWISLTLLFSMLCMWTSVECWSYYYSNKTMDWEQARAWCQEHYTDMVAIQNQEEIQHLNSWLPRKPYYYWIGIRKIKNVWTWVGTNKALTAEATSWAKGEPNNGNNGGKKGDSEDCVEMYIKRELQPGKWNDERCSKKKTALCYTAACKNDSCVYGECVETINSHMCSCFEGFYGERCEHVVKCDKDRVTEPANGKFTCTHKYGNFSYNSLCKYSCEEGYKLSEPTPLRCTASKEWSANPPTCELVQCPELSSPERGSMKCSDPLGSSSYQSTCVFTCDEGFELTGSPSDTLQCEASGSWNAPQPTCVAVQCTPIAELENGFVSCGGEDVKFIYGNTCSFSCASGYRLVGESDVTCTSAAEWSGRLPRCEAITCRNPEGDAHLISNCSASTDQRPGSTCSFSCEAGFALQGEHTIQCSEEGQWSTSIPTCKVVQCPELSSPERGSMKCSDPLGSSSYQSTCVFTSVQCTPIAELENGSVSCGDEDVKFIYGNTCSFSCASGYQLVGESDVTCTSAAEWSGRLPRCEAVLCPLLEAPENGHMNCSDNQPEFSSQCSFTCSQDYTLDGHQLLTCDHHGNWTGERPTCQASPSQATVVVSGVATGGALLSGLSIAMWVLRKLKSKANKFELNSNSDIEAPPQTLKMQWTLFLLLGSSLAGTTLCWTYHYSNKTMNWTEARRFCQDNFTDLVVIQSQYENDYLVKMLPTKNGSPYYWIGITKKHKNETWTWVGNNSTWVGNESWAENEPNNNHIAEFCVEIYVNTGTNRGKWNDELCSKPKYPVCYQAQCNATSCGRGTCSETIDNIMCHCEDGFEGDRCQIAKRCPTLNSTAHGSLRCVDPHGEFSVGSRCTSTCGEGFLLKGRADTDCGMPNLPPPDNGDLSCSGRTFNSTCQLKCHQGFLLTDSRSVTCGPTGDWSGPRPICTSYKQALLAMAGCGALSACCCICFCWMKRRKNLSRGGGAQAWTYNYSITPSRRWFEARGWCQQHFKDIVAVQNQEENDFINNLVPYNSKYYWIGVHKVAEEWTWEETNKIVPNDLQNWATDEPDNIAGQDCVEIYIKRDKDTAKWNNEKCRQRKGTICYSDSCTQDSCSAHADCVETVGSFTCQCHTGFFGHRCEEAITCNPLPEPEQGSHYCSHPYGSYRFNSSCRFHCELGFRLVGSPQLLCQSSGQWDHPFPLCQVEQCPDLKRTNISDGTINCNHPIAPYSYNSTCEVRCDEGYELSGESLMRCDHTGQWTASVPACTIKKCPPILFLDSGDVACVDTVEPFSFGSWCDFTCQEGYYLTGDSTLTCLASGEWSKPSPTCTVVQCNRLEAPPHASVQCQGPLGEYNYGSICTMQCEEGFDLIGTNMTKCSSHGSWSHALPVCRAKSCYPIASPLHGSISCSHPNGPFSFGSQCTSTCDDGFLLNGTGDTECTSQGTWSADIPRCLAKRCPTINSPTHGSFSCLDPHGEFSFGSQCTSTCEEGFLLNGTADTNCTSVGKWSRNVPLCLAKRCPSLSPPTHGSLSCSDPHEEFSFSSQCMFTCEEGFVLNGTGDTECTSVGMWSTKTPHCMAKRCHPLVPPAHGSLLCSDPHGESSFGSQCTSTCKDGFVLNGTADTECTSLGTWSRETAHCLAVQCETIPALSLPLSVNCSHPLGNFSFGTKCLFTCSGGFSLNGTEALLCSSSGFWSDSLPNCTVQAIPGGAAMLINSPVGVASVVVPLVLIALACLTWFLLTRSKKRVGYMRWVQERVHGWGKEALHTVGLHISVSPWAFSPDTAFSPSVVWNPSLDFLNLSFPRIGAFQLGTVPGWNTEDFTVGVHVIPWHLRWGQTLSKGVHVIVLLLQCGEPHLLLLLLLYVGIRGPQPLHLRGQTTTGGRYGTHKHTQITLEEEQMLQALEADGAQGRQAEQQFGKPGTIVAECTTYLSKMEPTPALWALLLWTWRPVANRMPSFTVTERCENEAISSSFQPGCKKKAAVTFAIS